MKVIEVLDLLVNYVKDCRADMPESVIKNKHMNDLKGDEEISQEVVDAILVDFINQIGIRNGIDYALYTKDLKED